MSRSTNHQYLCPLCGQKHSRRSGMPVESVMPAFAKFISRHHPDWDATGYVCLPCLDRLRAEYIQDAIEEEHRAMMSLQKETARSIRQQELVAQNINVTFDQNLTFGQRMADKIASFGGSWTFIILFATIIMVWIALNTWALIFKPFDPYPYILLNLCLSCLAAVQAPIIMMSQNRQEDKDRLRAEHDFRVNLKAELEIRHLHAKLDQLLTRQWQRLLEIQQIQMEMMEEVARKGK